VDRATQVNPYLGGAALSRDATPCPNLFFRAQKKRKRSFYLSFLFLSWYLHVPFLMVPPCAIPLLFITFYIWGCLLT